MKGNKKRKDTSVNTQNKSSNIEHFKMGCCKQCGRKQKEKL